MELKFNIIEGNSKFTKRKNDFQRNGMDRVHNPDQRHWIGPKLKLKKYFEEFDKVVVNSREGVNAKINMKKDSLDIKKMKNLVEASDVDNVIPKEIFQEVVENCDIDRFTLKSEMEPIQQFSEVRGNFPKFVSSTAIPPSATETLHTLQMQQQFLEKSNNLEKVKRMRSLRNSNNAYFEACPPLPTRMNQQMLDKQIVIAVRVYRPVKGTAKNVAASMTTVNRFVQEIYMLGSNKLSQLRDLIKCSGDYIVPGDVSESAAKIRREKKLTSYVNKTMIGSSGQTARELYKSAFIFIEDCFYNDMRWSNDCKDYSEVIRDWALDQKREIGPFKTANMEDTAIEDLTIRLGYPYVYVHQGDHEHLISFVEARLVSTQDLQNPEAYPYERGVGMVHSKMCMACNKFIAKWVTCNNERVPEDPFFFCDDCFHQFNYNSKGEKIGKFVAYTYIDVNAL